MTTTYTGKVIGDTIKGKTRSERDGKPQSRDWEAKRAGTSTLAKFLAESSPSHHITASGLPDAVLCWRLRTGVGSPTCVMAP